MADTQHNVRNYLLDPLSVIVKLAILAHKPVGTKICIYNNVLSLQDPGPFQGLCRMIYSANKSDLHYIYNPIHIACESFLLGALKPTSAPAKEEKYDSWRGPKTIPHSPMSSQQSLVSVAISDDMDSKRMRILFMNAQKGLEKLMETYRTDSAIRHSLHYYSAIISTYLEPLLNVGIGIGNIFRKDSMTILYSDALIEALNSQWSDKWLTLVLDIIGFLNDDVGSTENIRTLESLMESIDAQTESKMRTI